MPEVVLETGTGDFSLDAASGGLVGGPGAGRTVRLCGGPSGRSRGSGRDRRDGLPQEGDPLGGGSAAVLRHAGQGGQLPGGGFPGLRRGPRPHAAGPGTVPARGLDRRPSAAVGRGIGPRHALRDQAGPGAGAGSGTAPGLGDGGHGLRPFAGATRLAGGARPAPRAGGAPQRRAEGRPRPSARGARANAGTTGSAGCWRNRRRPTGATNCSSAVPWRTRTTGRPTWPSRRRAASWRRSWPWPAAAGASSKPSRPLNRRRDWTSTRCAARTAGTGT